MNPFIELFGNVAIFGPTAIGDWNPTFSTGDPPEFVEIYESASRTLEADPSNTEAHFMRGVVCNSKRWYEQALADFAAVVKNDPRHARAWMLMSEVLTSLGKTDKALIARQQALELDPNLR